MKSLMIFRIVEETKSIINTLCELSREIRD